MNHPEISPTEQLCSLIREAADAKCLKKAVFSKSSDEKIKRAVLMSKNIRGEELFQIEIFCTDNKALHRNLSKEDEALCDFAEGFGQINLLTTAGDCERKNQDPAKKFCSVRKKCVSRSVPERASI